MNYKTIMFAGPSAVGKTYIAEELMKFYPNEFEQAKLYTTRLPRDGEVASDRIFISNKQFNLMKESGDFVVAEEFGGNWYGFTKDSITPAKKHLLVNIWPWLTEEFSKMEHVIIIGMMPPENWEPMLVQRMKNRGETAETIKKRKQLIKKDINDLLNQKKYVQNSGKMFTVENDQTVSEEIFPWIQRQLILL